MNISEINSKKVLIIEKEVDFCLFLQYYLEKKDCNVTISHSVNNALGEIEKDAPEVIICDSQFRNQLELIRNKLPEALILEFPNSNDQERLAWNIDWDLVLGIICILLFAFLAFRFLARNNV